MTQHNRHPPPGDASASARPNKTTSCFWPDIGRYRPETDEYDLAPVFSHESVVGPLKVVLAEKPSVARDIARVLGCRTRADGHWTGNGYAVTWAFGHLVAIAEPAAMNPAWAKPWRKEQLPMVPPRWRYEVTKDGKKQFAVIKKLLNAPDTAEIIAATDAGREGEHIFRLIYQRSGSKKPVKRLWIRSLTDEAIREGFRSLEPLEAFDALAAAASSRAHADWLMGLNFTRAYTVHNRQLCTVGRVQTPTLALLVNRHHEIQNFVSQTYYEVHAVLEPGFTAEVCREGQQDPHR